MNQKHKSAAPEIEVGEWLAELEAATRARDDGMTVREWSEATGYSDARMRKLLRQAESMGRLVTGRQARKGLGGIIMPVPVYKVVGKPKR